MSFLVVPKEARSHWADVWLATDQDPPPANARLFHPGGALDVGAGWQAWHRAGEGIRLHHQQVRLTGLAPRTDASLELRVAGNPVATARLSTLPDRLPGRGAPLTFFLGSCYCWAKDGDSRVDSAYRRVPTTHRPDFKILCGDQIYLDAPWPHFLRNTHDEGEMREIFLERYWTTWGGVPGRPGLAAVLADGANFFSPDDHELWNNAPNRASVVRDSWRQSGRDRWRQVAGELYDLFQTPKALTRFDVPPLSFCLVDTRMDRDADEVRFMTDTHLQQLVTWIERLSSPGVLVLGQPIFADTHGIAGHFADWGLADYRQYEALVAALHQATHSVLVLTGDVHYRRVAASPPPPNHEILEVISSPLTLVDGKAGGAWKRPPERFPARTVARVPPQKIEVEEKFQAYEDHFLILQCHAVGPAVDVQVFDFDVRGSPAPGGANPVAEVRLR